MRFCDSSHIKEQCCTSHFTFPCSCLRLQLEARCRASHDDFSESDFQTMFAMNGPR